MKTPFRLSLALALSTLATAGESTLFKGRSEIPLPRLPFAFDAVVTSDGGLRYGNGVRVSAEPTGDLAFPRGTAATRKFLGGGIPIVVTTRESDKLAIETTAFAPSNPPLDALRIVLRNKTAAPLSPVLRVAALGAQGTLPAPLTGFQAGGTVLALCDTTDGKPVSAPPPKAKQHVFQQRGGQAMPNWGHPKVACDRGFNNIVAGMQEPATFLLKAEPDKRYVVAVGLCESHWKGPGNRICDILIEKKKVATVDPCAKPYGTDVPFVLTFPAADANKDGWIEVTSVGARGSPDVNSIVNVLWLFDEEVGKALAASDILSGSANERAACYVDCGGGGAPTGPTVVTLDFRFELPPNGSATLWLKKPGAPVKASEVAKLAEADPAKLLAATEEAWRQERARFTIIRFSDPAPCDNLFLAYVTLRCLCSREGAVATVRPEPFSTAFSPRVTAHAATALDRLGAHAEAAAVLAGLVARQGDDRLWAEAGDPWTSAGPVLRAFPYHFDLTADRACLEASYRPLLSAAEAILEARELTKWIAHDPDDATHGLMPTAAYGAVPQDQWLAHAASAAAGVGAVARAARALDRRNDCLWLEDNLREMLSCIGRAARQYQGPVRVEAKGAVPLAEEAAGCITRLLGGLVLGQDDELHLLPYVPKTWLSKEVVVTDLPTAFGPLSFKASLAADGRKLIVEPQWKPRRAPKAIIVHPPVPAGDSKPVTVTDIGLARIELDLR